MNTVIYKRIRRPVITEKTTRLKGDQNTLCFEVARDAGKVEIREYIEKLFNVKVQSVRM
jgi:large subunit ribosomal protein L23